MIAHLLPMPGPRGRTYFTSPHFCTRWTNRTLLPLDHVPGAVRTARVFAVARNGAEALWAVEERRVLIAKMSAEGVGWVLLTVLYEPHPALRAFHPSGTRAAAFWLLHDKMRPALRLAVPA